MIAPPDCQNETRILLAVTGLSPQIVTETLYALAVEGTPAWIPDEIHLITTRKGEENARLALLSENPGWFHRLRKDYGLPEITFNRDNIHVIIGPEGKPLDDILTNEDNEAVADFITEQVRALTADPAISLHVTIAGGRKTMGFYVGYALSLFGRPQDELSHVLVSPPFESLADFYYPSPRTRVILDRTEQPVDAKEARVHLGKIPFVRLRDSLPKHLLEGRAPFSEAVAEAQRALPPVALTIDPASCRVIAADKAFLLEPMLFAFYWMMAERCRAARGGLRRDDGSVGKALLDFYGRLVNQYSGAYERAETTYQDFGIEKFDQTKTKVNRAVKRALGDHLAAPYLIGKLDRVADSRIHNYGLSLPPGSVTIASASLPTEQDFSE